MITFLINRARRHWQVLSTVLLGVLISTALLASGPLIVDTVMDFALPNKLRSSLEKSGTILLTNYNKINADQYKYLDIEIKDILNSNIGGFSTIISSIGSSWAYPWQNDTLIDDERINFIAYSGIEDRVNFISGDWPESGILYPHIINVVIFEPLSQAYGLGVGDRIPMSLKINETEPTFWIEVSGIVKPKNASDPFWMIEHNPYQPITNPRYIAQYHTLLSDDSLFQVTEAIFPITNLELNWLGVIDPDQIKPGIIGEILDGIESTRTEISNYEKRIALKTNLDYFLVNFESQVSTVRAPLYLLVGEVLFLGLYYVVMVAALSFRQVEGEFATLISRGASMGQLFRIQTFEALLICSVAFICGPLLAYGMVWSLARFGPISDISQIDWVATLPTASWIAAGISVLACFTALLIPVIPSLRSSIVEHSRKITRRTKKPWWHRYYIDVFLLVIGLFAIWRLSLYGSISGSIGGSIDWLLLFAPLALLIGSATILLRLFPSIFQILAKLAARGRGLTAALAFWQTSRDPTHVTRLVLLFTLAMALGILSTGLSATLNFSETERARYATGGEVRLSSDTFIPLSTFSSIPYITSASAVWRGEGRANVRTYRSMPEFTLLAIDPFSFVTVSQYRADFTDNYIGFVLGQLAVDPEQLPVTTIPIPGRPTHFGVWVADPFPAQTDIDLTDYLFLKAKIQSSEGEINNIDLELTSPNDQVEGDTGGISKSKVGLPVENQILSYFLTLIFNAGVSETDLDIVQPLELPTWHYFEASLPTYAVDGYPISLHSLWLKIRPVATDSGLEYPSQGPLVIDDITIAYPDGQLQIIEGFEELTTIWQTTDSQSIASYTKRDITHSGEASMRLFLGAPGTSSWMVISPAQTIRQNLLPVVASPIFLEMTGLKIGDEFIAQTNGISLPLEIKDSVNYFPTMYETNDSGFLVIARDSLLAELNRTSRKPENYNETWLTVDTRQDIPTLLEDLPQVTNAWEVENERRVYKSDPLTLGLRSVIFLGYSFTLLLSLVGFTTYFYLNARQRESVYGILRSLGLSTRQLYGSLILEQLVLISAGLALGVFLGSLLNEIILPGLPISYGDVPPIPPFVPQEDWIAVIKLVLIMISSFVLTLAIGTYLLWRTRLHQVLRIGEE